MSRKIQLTRGRVAVVDDADFEWLNQWKWCVSDNGYAKRHVNIGYAQRYSRTTPIQKRREYMHRLILGLTDPKIQADHIDGNRLNNCRSNLRICTHSQNMRNRRRRTNCSSEFKGVSWKKAYQKWAANIGSGAISLGYFDCPKLAAWVYDSAATELFGEFARLNFPAKRPLAAQ